MGLEARCTCRWTGGAGDVKALLESHELILRGVLRRIVPLKAITRLQVEAEDLAIHVGDETIHLTLGREKAARWARKILAPPPTLAAKLGIGPNTTVLAIGPLEEPALKEAVAQGQTSDTDTARLCVAVVMNGADLDQALGLHALLPAGSPLWIVHGKGPKATFGETLVRQAMRDAGYRDSKSCAVSRDLSATRFAYRPDSA